MNSPSIQHVQYALRSGFTLLELMVAVVIMGIISVSVIPAMDNIRSMRQGAARDDMTRYIHIARGRAIASGTPYGIEIDLAESSLAIVRMNDRGDPEAVIDPLTNLPKQIHLQILYPGVSIQEMINGDGISGSGTVWFDFESNPMTYDSVSDNFVVNTRVVVISLSSGEQVMVHPYSGTVEVQ